MEQSSNKGLLIGTIIAAVLIFAGLIWAVLSVPSENGSALPNGQLSFSDENDPAIGPEDAKVVVRLFEDFQCPACRTAEAGTNYAIDKYKDRVRFIWDDFPLESLHRNARAAANAARCADEQGKFWEYKERLYAEQATWSNMSDVGDTFTAYAGQLEMDTGAFRQCFDEKRYDARIAADAAEAGKNGVRGTPTIFINNTMRNGLAPNEWDQLLQAALAE